MIKHGKKLSIAVFPAMLQTFYEQNPAKKKDLSLLAETVDQLVLMMYDTGFRAKETFRQHMVSHVMYFNRFTGNNNEIIIGVASYGQHTNKKYRWLHHPSIENIEVTIGLLQQYLIRNKGRLKIDGYAIFRYGTTESIEWEQFFELLK